TSISVYGTIAANAKHVKSIYTMDGSHPVVFTANPTRIVQYKQLFYQVSDLPYGQHKLIIACMTPGAQFWLDFLAVGVTISNAGPLTTLSTVIPTKRPTTAKSSSEISTTLSSVVSTLPSSSKSIVTLPPSTVTSFAGFQTVTPSIVPTPTSQSKPASSSYIIDVGHSSTSSFQATTIIPSSSLVSSALPSASSGISIPPGSSSQVTSAPSGNHAGAIAGGVIAILVCIALAVVTFLWFRRRRAMRAPSRQAPK
ncbi:hypothetical protein E4T56_gene11581, partial [Termitomyces sp. T112]